MKIEDAINQPKFQSTVQKASINLLYTASWYSSKLQHALKPFGISWQQFNIMRILRGQNGSPISLKLVSSRMIDHMSNTSRLVDKLVAKGFVARETASCDRRQLAITITDAGRKHLDMTSKVVEELSKTLLGHVGLDNLDDLNAHLNEIREKDI